MKAYWGSVGVNPLILWPRNLIEVSGQLHAPAALPQGKSPLYRLDRRLGGPQSRSGRSGSREKFIYIYISLETDKGCVTFGCKVTMTLVKPSLCLTKYHATKTHSLLNQGQRQEDVLGSGDTTPTTLNPDTRYRWIPRHKDILGEWRYSSAHSLTSALDGLSGQLHAPATLPPEPLWTRWWEKFPAPSGIEP
jgi:hypothetical protein